VLDCHKIAKNPQLDIMSKHDSASAVASMASWELGRSPDTYTSPVYATQMDSNIKNNIRTLHRGKQLSDRCHVQPTV